MVLVDDDFHSARLLMRMLGAHGAPEIQWVSDPDEAAGMLAAHASPASILAPCMVIVDLKSSSTATAEFIARLHKLAPGLVVAAMSPSLERLARTALLEAGATAVFQRHGELDLYRREAASIVSFWVRSQHLDAVGA
jgi:CheY-like chemotaxis protein